MAASLEDARAVAEDSIRAMGPRVRIGRVLESAARWYFEYGPEVTCTDGTTGVMPKPGGCPFVAIDKTTGDAVRLDFSSMPSAFTGIPPTADDLDIGGASEVRFEL